MAGERGTVRSLARHALDKTGLPEDVRRHLEAIRAEIDGAYRERFIELTQALHRQASALDRVTATLELLVERSAPELKGRVPGLKLAEPGTAPDLATIAADPIGAGYSLTQEDLARALNCSQPDVSVLLKALNLKDEPQLAMVVRKGKTREVVNYHARAVDRLLRVLAAPPKDLPRNATQALERIRRKRATFSGE